MTKILSLSVIGLFLIGIIVYLSMYVSYNNREISLRNQADAQNKNIEAVYDQMWKIISQKAQVSTEYKNAFKEIYPQLIEGRYSKGDGALMKWIQEQNPTFDTKLYSDLMVSIEAQRVNFTNQQKYMLDIIREHTNLLQQIPSCWFLKDKQPIQYEVISSSISKEVMESRLDDNVKVF